MKQYEVTSVGKFKLKAHDPDETGDYKKTDQGKDKAKADTAKLIARLAGLQERLYAENRRALLVVLQAMDTGGKDGTIRNVFSRLNPMGMDAVAFKAPSAEELDHDFL
ncbi:MAG: polyphosphate kinase 2 family protein, partial [Nitrospirota bacterium]